jgi:pimeloyl-ACP methyl ester carboxylesterase
MIKTRLFTLCSTALFSLLAVVIAGCSTDASIREKSPSYKPGAFVSGRSLLVEKALCNAMRWRREKPLAALSENLRAARAALLQLQSDPGDAVALRDYNFAVARVVGILRDSKLDPWSAPLLIPSPEGELVLTHKPDPRPRWNPALYTFTPADQFTIGGKYVEEHAMREGLGAPIVVVGRGVNKDYLADYALKKTYYGVTALIRFNGNKAVMEFADPLNEETISLNGRNYPLAADFTVPMAVMLAGTAPQIPKLERMLFPERYAETARLCRLEPYNPNKRVVLVIHGLMDSPTTWAPMIINLRGDPFIRGHYQFWIFSYPSGYPYPYSAAILRHELDGALKKYPQRDKIVVIGHSMGGCISRLLLTDANETLWKLLFNKTPAQTDLPNRTKSLFADALIFRHDSHVGRVIFISAPLKGSELATLSIGRIGSSLIRTPNALLHAGNDMMKIVTFHAGELNLRRAPNSIDTLSPKSRFVRMINKIPITPGIPYHTIIGDRGRGDSPNSSDGVVPYWSSHMDGAVSECIVPSDHMAHQKPQTFAEVARILKLNAGVP